MPHAPRRAWRRRDWLLVGGATLLGGVIARALAAPEASGRAADGQEALNVRLQSDQEEQEDHGAGAVFRGIEWIDGRFARRRSRLALLSLNDAELKDIGISRADAHGVRVRAERSDSAGVVAGGHRGGNGLHSVPDPVAVGEAVHERNHAVDGQNCIRVHADHLADEARDGRRRERDPQRGYDPGGL